LYEAPFTCALLFINFRCDEGARLRKEQGKLGSSFVRNALSVEAICYAVPETKGEDNPPTSSLQRWEIAVRWRYATVMQVATCFQFRRYISK
jgi:hypothetical protein